MSANTVPFSYRFGPINMQFQVFLENTDGWGPQDVEIEYDPNELVLPSDIAEKKAEIVRKKEEDAKKNNKVFFDGAQIGMKAYGHRPKDDEDNLNLYLKFRPSSFALHASTGQMLDQPILTGPDGKPTTIRNKYITDPYSFDDCLSNSTGVSTVLISKPDNAMVYVKRSDKISQYPGRYGVAAAGFMDQKKDMIDGRPDPFHTAYRELSEEMGTETRYGDFKLTGVGRPWDDLHGELWGFTSVDQRVEKIMSAPKKAKYETMGIYSIDFEPKKVMKLFSGGGDSWVNAHAAATVHTLINKYGFDEVINAAYEAAA